MNVISGNNGKRKEAFKTSDKPDGCTHEFSTVLTEYGFSAMDTPGLNDPNWPLMTWMSTFKK
jgi:ribosome biogenesis GTPase A